MSLPRIAVASLAVLVLAGCASTDERSSRLNAPDHRPGAIVTDAEYVASVEAIARRRHMDVVWVNPPKKRIPEDD